MALAAPAPCTVEKLTLTNRVLFFSRTTREVAHTHRHTPKNPFVASYCRESRSLVSHATLARAVPFPASSKRESGACSKQPRLAVLLLAHAHARAGHGGGEAVLGVPLGHVAVRAAPGQGEGESEGEGEG